MSNLPAVGRPAGLARRRLTAVLTFPAPATWPPLARLAVLALGLAILAAVVAGRLMP